jgi:hypothetical protein
MSKHYGSLKNCEGQTVAKLDCPFDGGLTGELNPARWQLLNKHLSKHAGILSREEIVHDFCEHFRIPRWRVEAQLATFRHLGTDTWH